MFRRSTPAKGFINILSGETSDVWFPPSTMALLPYHIDSVLLVGLAALIVHSFIQRRTNTARLPVPPGPPPLPVIGNLLDLPVAAEPWKAYAGLSQRYGDVVHLSVFGQTIIILSSLEAISDLFEKRSTIYSSRPHSTMLHELMGMDWSLAIMPYGEEWRKVRRGFHQYFNSNVAPNYHTVHEEQSHDFLKRLRQTPEDFLDHIRHAFAATIMKVTYGIEVKDADNEYIHLAENAIIGFNAAAQPGRFLVDSFSPLRYVPAWMPGADFQRLAAHWKEVGLQMLNKPFDAVKSAVASGSAVPSVASDMIEHILSSPDREEQEAIARRSAGIAYVGGADTTISAVSSFFLAMAMYPEVQKKAQAELDAVVGPNRLPTFADRPSLPYIEAIVKEILRWKLVTPMSVPHCTSADDEYRGFFIPKGSVVFAAAWSILHNPVEFPDPESFNPDRFLKDGKLNPDVLDPTVACFGFGRRICAGRYFALNQLYSTVATVLHIFNISPALDDKGHPIPVEPHMSSGIVSYPEPFKCNIKPRSPAADALTKESHHE